MANAEPNNVSLGLFIFILLIVCLTPPIPPCPRLPPPFLPSSSLPPLPLVLLLLAVAMQQAEQLFNQMNNPVSVSQDPHAQRVLKA